MAMTLYTPKNTRTGDRALPKRTMTEALLFIASQAFPQDWKVEQIVAGSSEIEEASQPLKPALGLSLGAAASILHEPFKQTPEMTWAEQDAEDRLQQDLDDQEERDAARRLTHFLSQNADPVDRWPGRWEN